MTNPETEPVLTPVIEQVALAIADFWAQLRGDDEPPDEADYALAGNIVHALLPNTLHGFDGPRGLVGWTKIVDTDATPVSVQESSAVHVGTSSGGSWDGPFVWLRICDDEYARPGGLSGITLYPAAHLTPAMAREIAAALLIFSAVSAEDEAVLG